VQVEFDAKDKKRFVNEAIERYLDLANMRKWVHWVLYQKCQMQCLMSLNGFCLLSLYQYSWFLARIDVMVIVYYFGPRIIFIWVCDDFYTLQKSIFCYCASMH
jgi:hypothetical protein